MSPDQDDIQVRKSVSEQLGRHLEGALIAAAFSSGDMLGQFDALPEPSDFIAGWNPILWECILETRRAGDFSTARFVELLKGHSFSVDEVNSVIGTVNKAFLYSEEVKQAVDFLLHRRLVLRSQTCVTEYLATLEREPFYKAGGNLDRLQRQLADVAAGATSTDSWAFGDAVSSEAAPCVRTGLRDLDEMMGGLQMGVLGIIGARPSIGKTAAACALALNIARMGGGVGIFSLEMPAYDLQCRLAAANAYDANQPLQAGNSGNPYYQPFFHKKMGGAHLMRMNRSLEEVRRLPIAFDASKGLAVSDIRARTRRLKAILENKGQPLKVVFVDHIGHVKPEINRGGNRTSETTDISKGLMDMAGELGIAVVGLSQLSRAVEQRANKRPVLSDLRESGSLEQDAAYVTFLYRDEYYADRAHDDDDMPAKKQPANRNVLEFIIAKQRNGPVGTVETFCEIGANAILDGRSYFSVRAA